jgi:hypothetical protein
MNARRLIIAVVVPVVVLAAVALAAAMPSQRHHQNPSYGQQADAGPLLQQPALQHRGGSGGDSAALTHQAIHSSDSLSTRTKSRKTVSVMANVDFASGGYGQYNSAALRHSWVQGVDINLDWRYVEPSPGTFNWAPLDRTATAWANAGKHVALVVRAADEIGGGCSATGWGQMLPGWEINALHNALGRVGTFCDKGVNGLVPDWFSGTFQSDFRALISALGAHVSRQPYYRSISYVRIAVGLGGEGFYLMPGQNGYSADKSWMETHWHYTPRAWENFQEGMLAAYRAAFPSAVQLIYPLDPQDDLSPNNQVDVAVAKWATNYGGIGIGAECLPPAGLDPSMTTIDRWVRANHPNAYIQFQTCGQTGSASAEHGIIKAAESYGAKSIEWYQNTIVRPPSESNMTAYQTWVNNTFGD